MRVLGPRLPYTEGTKSDHRYLSVEDSRKEPKRVEWMIKRWAIDSLSAH